MSIKFWLSCIYLFSFIAYTFTVSVYTWTIRDEIEVPQINMNKIINKFRNKEIKNKDNSISIAIIISTITIAILIGLLYILWINIPYILIYLLG